MNAFILKVFFFAACFSLASACHKEYSCESCIPSNNPPPPIIPDPTPGPGPEPEPNTDDAFFSLLVHETAATWTIQSGTDGVTQLDEPAGNAPSICSDGFKSFSIGGSKQYATFFKGAGSYNSLEEAKVFFAAGPHRFAQQLDDPVPCCPCRQWSEGVVLLIRDEKGMWWRSDIYKPTEDYGFEIMDQILEGDQLKILAHYNWTFYNEKAEYIHIIGMFRLRVW